MTYREVRELWLMAIRGEPLPVEQVERLAAECMRVFERLDDKTNDLFTAVDDVRDEHTDDLEEKVEELEDRLEERNQDVRQLEKQIRELEKS